MMRVDAGIGRPAPAGTPAGARGIVHRLGRLDRFELGVLCAFGAVSLWVLGLDLWQVVVHGRVWTGTDGVYIVDQMQYLAWIRSASDHVFSSNLFVLRSTPADYFQPAVLISGALVAVGMAPWLSLLIWKPVAVIALFFGVRAFAHRSLEGVWERRLAILLTLFFGSFTVIYGSFGVIGDLFPGFLTWGYEFGLIALAAMIWGLLGYDRARAEGRIVWVPGLLGGLASLLHPWHGELMIVVLIGAELFEWVRRRPSRRQLELMVLTIALTGLPLLYYVLLGRFDLSWKLARQASKHAFPIASIVIVIVPLMIPAAFAYRRRPPGFLSAVACSWPLAAFAVYLVSATGLSATPLHAFQGITLPLAVLAIRGVQRFSWRRVPHRAAIAGALVAAFTIPATISELKTARELASPTRDNSNFIEHDERAAIEYLEKDKQPGGVFTRSYLGTMIPQRTGRRTLVGDCLWSEPNCFNRQHSAQALFDGRLDPDGARTLVRQAGAAYILADCKAKADLSRTLGPLLVSVHRFGCATVYTLDSPTPAVGPLAQSGGDAALRAPWRQQRHG
jgi:hypothetical protein